MLKTVTLLHKEKHRFHLSIDINYTFAIEIKQWVFYRRRK